MTRWAGNVGFATAEYIETSPGVYEEVRTVRKYRGDIVNNYRRYDASQDGSNDNINMNMKISLIADPYLHGQIEHLLYAEYKGSKWKITGIEGKAPRIIVDLGGVYNDPSNTSTQ